MKKIITIVSVTLLFSGFFSCSTGRVFKSQEGMEKNLEQVLQISKSQYEFLSTKLPDSLFPKTYQNGKYNFCKSGDWVSGFYPGTLILLSEHLKDPGFYSLAVPKLRLLEKEQFNKNTHDLGFMMYCSFGNAIRLHPSEKYNEVLVNSAKSLASRFNTNVGAIKSWNSRPADDFLVIIDNMMNLELLFWAAKHTGDRNFYDIAVTHANTTIKNHFRNDYSSYHVVNYDPASGAVKSKKTHQGAFDESAWTRGQAWALYGYTMMFRETKDAAYLSQANQIAAYILPKLPADYIPVWDFNSPEKNQHHKDASAGAIIASALLELGKYSPNQAKQYFGTAEKILSSLSSPAYFAPQGENGGFLLKHGVGHLPANSEVDAPLSYGDYYFVEAIIRYLALAKAGK